MTSSWNNFSIGKLDPKESTTPAAPVLGTTLNLASLAPHDSTPVAPKPANGGGNILDAGSGFVTGFGKQAVGTLDAVFGVDNVLLKKNIAAGGSGSTAEGMGWMPAAGKLIHGVSSTVSLAYNNPDAILKIPGQLANTWNNGDWATKGDMAGQATFIIGSLFVGGTGAAKASRVAGDLREASVVTKGVSTLGETGTTARALETTVNGLKAGTNVLGDVGTLGRTTTALTDGANLAKDANLIARTGAVDQTVAANLIKTGSFSERVLPLASEGSTKFLIQGETAGSVGLGEISLPNRLLGLQSTEGGAGVVSKFLSRFKPATEFEPTLATTVKGVIPKLGETGTAELITGKVAGATNDLTGAGRIAETLTGRTATEAERLTGLGRVTETVAPGVGKVTESVAPQVLRTEHAVQTVDTLAPHIDQFAQQANILKTTGNVAHTETFAELETGLAKFKAAGTTADRLENLGQLNRTVSVLEQQGVDAAALRGSLTRLQAETQTAERLSQMRTVTADIAEHSTSLTSQTAELTAKFGTKPSIQELELATKQLTQATTAAEKAQAFTAVERASAKVIADIPAESGAALRTSVEALRAPVQTATKIETAAQIADHTATLSTQTAELTAKFGTKPSIQELELATKQLTQATTAAEKAQAFTAVERASAKVIADIPAESGAALRTSVEALKAPVQTAVKIETAAQIADRTATLSTQTAELTATFGTRPAVQELGAATKQLTEATTAAERAQAFSAVEKASAKVIADLPAESGAALRTTVESLRAPVQIAAKSEAADLVVTQIADRSAALTKQVTELTTSSATPAVRELNAATKQLTEATTATERAQAFAAVEKASAKVMTEVPAETGAALRTTVDALRTPIQAAARSEVADLAATQIADRASTLTSQTAELATKYGTNASVQELTTATKQLTEATTAAEKAQAFAAVDRAAAKVATDIPEAGAAIRQTVESLRVPVQTAVKVEASEVVATQIAQRSTQLVSETTQLAAKFSDNVAVQELNTATREFSQASSAVEKADAYARVEKAAAAVKDLSPEGAQVARTVESLSAPVETAARAQRLETAVVQIDERASSLTVQTRSLVQDLTVEGKVPATVRELDNAAARMSEATNATEKTQAFQALQKSATEVAAEFPGQTTQISRTVESMAPHVETAERLTQVENVTSRVAYQADDVAQQAALLKSSAALKTETALTELQTSASMFKAATSTERAEQLAQMNKNLRLVEAEVGEAKVAGLRTSVARLENEAGTLDRIAAVDKSTVQVTQQSQVVLKQAAELQAGTTNVTVQTALKNIQLGATETGTINAINRTEQLSLRANDIAVVERELGTVAAGKIRTAIADLDRSTAAARTNAVELLDYQGAKITQQVGYLQEGGRLGTNTQALRIDQLQHDVAVMKSIVPADSVVTSHLLRLEQQVNGVDSIANILAHPEVARAPGRELLKLAQSSDAATATAAADRLILKGNVEKLAGTPVAGLISERQQFWNTQKQLSQLEGTVKAQLFESGKLFGLPSSEPIFRKTLSDIAWATGGLLTLDGSMAYNLNKISAMARDNVLSAEAAAKARDQDQQPKKDAESKPVESKSETNNSQTQAAQSSQPAAAGQNSNAIANVQAKASDAQSGDNNYVRTAQQATFKNDATEVKMSPVAAVYGTPKFLASEETNNIPAGSFPTAGASWWWKQQHGGSPWGFQRGPGVVAAQEVVKQNVQITPRARGIAATPEADLTKIAQVRFPIPRVMDISNQAMLLNSPNQFSSRAGRNGSGIGSGGPGARSWTTVDWSQIGAHRLSSSEGGKAAHDLSKLEKDEESGMDAPGNGAVTAQNMLGGPNGTHDPSNVDPSNDPNVVVATNNKQKQQGQDDESLVARI
jgi:hypothetical protein